MTTTVPFPQSSTAPVGPVVPLPAGVRIDRFVIEQTLHQGPHGFAYRVRESGHHQPLALLECFPRALAIRQPDGAVRARQAGDAIALSVVCEAFVQDARALAAIEHPGVVKVFGVINANRTVYRLMPFIDGQTLEEQRLERPEPPTVGGLVRLYDKLLDALEALHRAGFVHGLVQPDQILIKADDNAPVLLGMDGVAIELGEVTMSPWAAPEQQQATRFERINASADLYMLAATMCFAATGAAPPRAEERLMGDPWDPAAMLADVPLGGGDAPALRDGLIQAIVASLALAAAARPQHADDVRHILHPRGNDGFVASTGPTPLWVGEVPDRDSQWETLSGMSGPAPLNDDTRARQMLPDGHGADAVVQAEPVHAAAALESVQRAARRASHRVAARRGGRTIVAGVVSAALALAFLAWWSQRPPTTLPLPQGAGPDAQPPAPAPAPWVVTPQAAEVTPPAPAPAAAATAAPADAAPASALPQADAVPPAAAAAATGSAAGPATSTRVAAPASATAPADTAKAASPPAAKAREPAAQRMAQPSVSAKAAKAAPARAPAAKPPPRKAEPEELCSNRTQFSYLYCMRDACARPANRNNGQCVSLRRSGDLR